ncbi:MAG TPA: SDR family oxidoreductase [Bryobacteraceae bacterium]|jgi:short-subunit dehydrogenase|nr:SDR family oxidoreductase [Bryobacteraceae bacterium]
MPEQHQEVVVVTGASAGVGRAVVREFAQRGAHIGLLARGQSRLEEAKAEVERYGGRALALPTDVARAKEVEHAADQVERQFGPIDVWVNNAMTTIFAPFEQITPEEFKRATDVTYLGCVYGTMAALRRMKRRNCGTIVQVGSALAYRSIPLQSPYCGAKHAIVGFTDSLRCELLHDQSRVHLTVVHLPGMNTPQFSWCRTRLPRHPMPMGPVFEPEVAARAIYWAAHHHRREVYVGWPTIKAIYGQELAPELADKYLAETGYDGQQTAEPVDANRPDNLFEPVPGPFAARGIFSDRAKNTSIQTWMDLHRKQVALAAAGIAGVAALLARRAA